MYIKIVPLHRVNTLQQHGHDREKRRRMDMHRCKDMAHEKWL